MKSSTPILELRDVHKSFGAVQVLRGVNLSVPQGSIVALVGDNGAGKSTLIKSLAGIHRIDEGKILWKGQQERLHEPKDSSRLGMAFVYQDLALCDNLTVTQNMFLGREMTKFGRLDTATMKEHAGTTFKSLAVTTVKSLDQKVGSLSGGQKQAVAIARAVMEGAELVVLDEPTAALGVAQTAEVNKLLRDLANHGVSVLLISHNISDVMKLADQIWVLRLGEMVAQLNAGETDQNEVVQLITTGKTV